MFAPHAAVGPTKAAERPTSKPVIPRQTLAARPFLADTLEQAHLLARSIGNQATLALLSQRELGHAGKAAGGDHGHQAAPDAMTDREASRGVSWDFSRIPIFSPDQADRSDERSAFNTTRLRGVIQPKLAVGEVNDPLEQEADRVAAQVMRMPEPKASIAAAPLRLSRRCATCGDEQAGQFQTTPRGQSADADSEAPAAPHAVLRSPGQPLDKPTRAFFEPRFGRDLSRVRVHTDGNATRSASLIGARAYTCGRDIFYGPGERPGVDRLTAHELAHVAQQSAGVGPAVVRRYGTPIPDVDRPTVKTMQEFIELVGRIEATNPGLSALQIAQMIMRSKYHSTSFDWLLPSTAATKGVAANSSVTADDVTTLSGEFTITLPQGVESDPTHIVVGIVAAAEKQAPGAQGAGGFLGKVVTNPPAGLSQLDIATWAGDPGSAAGEWMTAHPHPKGGTTMQSYMDEFSPESDMIGDVDGVAITATSAGTGFVFNPAASLAENLRRFYFPVESTQGKNRRFHTFLNVLGFTLEPDKVSLSDATKSAMDNRIHLFADWYMKNEPNILTWMALNSPPSAGPGDAQQLGWSLFNPVPREWVKRANDWSWFAKQFRDFIQRNLTAEGP